MSETMSEKRAVHMKGIRNQILRTAEKLFLTQGYKTTTIRQIVQDSGITSGSIYNIFEDKEHLFAALADEFMAKAKAKIDGVLEGESAERRIVGLLAMELYCTEQNPVIRELACAFHTSPFLMETLIKRHSVLAEEIWMSRRHPRNSSLDTAILISEGMISSYLISFDFSQKMNYDEIRRKVVALILKALGLEARESSHLIQYMEENKALWLDLADQVLNHSDETPEEK